MWVFQRIDQGRRASGNAEGPRQRGGNRISACWSAAQGTRRPRSATHSSQKKQGRSNRPDQNPTRAPSRQIKIGDVHASAVLALLKGISQDTHNPYLQATPDHVGYVQAGSHKHETQSPVPTDLYLEGKLMTHGLKQLAMLSPASSRGSLAQGIVTRMGEDRVRASGAAESLVSHCG
jgi:hypothetical protein